MTSVVMTGRRMKISVIFIAQPGGGGGRRAGRAAIFRSPDRIIVIYMVLGNSVWREGEGREWRFDQGESGELCSRL